MQNNKDNKQNKGNIDNVEREQQGGQRSYQGGQQQGSREGGQQSGGRQGGMGGSQLGGEQGSRQSGTTDLKGGQNVQGQGQNVNKQQGGSFRDKPVDEDEE